ncbi:MAG: histidine kinase [Dehalococcoidia bacterium]|nr:histidine kinase [Dehalococcoidia bacterium]
MGPHIRRDTFGKAFRNPLPALRKINLWPRLVFGASLGFLMLLAVLGLLILRVVDDSRERILQERLVIAQMAARQVDSILEHDFRRLESAAATVPAGELQQQAPGVMPEHLARLLDDVDDMWLAIYVMDAHGNVVAAAPEGRAQAGAPPAGVEDLEAAGAVGHAVSAPYVDPASGQPAAMLRVPLGAGDPPLLLGGVMNLSGADLLDPLSSAKGLGRTGHAELFDSQGRVIASTDPAQFLATGEHRHLYLRLHDSMSEGVETVPLEPRSAEEAQQESPEHIMAVSHLAGAPWGVAVGGDASETLAPVTDLRNNILLLGAVSLVVLWLATLIGARLLARPVRALTGAADRMRAGDLDSPIRVGEGGEIGRLGETLEAMRVRLSASLQEIEQRDQELESRVQERTQEVQRLFRELQRKEELRSQLLQSVISAQEDERKRIARELHDETGQALTGIIMSVESAQSALAGDPAAASQRLAAAAALARQGIDAIRQLVVDLRPAALDDLGLVPALRAFAENRLGDKGIRLQMETSGMKDRLSAPIETCLFRVVQEAVTNTIRHSEATSARIELRRTNGVVSMLVEDDGKGFDVAAVTGSLNRGRALGLAGMEERLALVGGGLTVESAPGRGTRIRATFRLDPEDAP